MKQWVRKTVAGVLAATALTSMAGAANFTHCADALKQMELFVGTKNGYELDRAPTRAEAAVMLVRLLGQEDVAKSGSYDIPFTDVPNWAAPYVGWLYENELTVGVSDTKFGTTQNCNAKQYATFLLRALGYADGSDGYTYDTALDFAQKQGVVDAVNCDSQNFLRDDVVAMSYTALSRPTKEGADTLLDALIERGSVNKSKASDTLTLFQSYHAYLQSKEQTNKTNPRTYKLDVTITDNAYNSLSCTGTATVDGNRFSAELRQGDVLVVGLYQNDGVLYQYQNGQTVRAEQPVTLGQDTTLPISAVAALSVQNEKYAFSLVPSTLDSLVSMTGATLKQVDYSVRTQDGLLNQQTGRIHLSMPVNGKTATYEIEVKAVLADTAEQVSVPEGMEI